MSNGNERPVGIIRKIFDYVTEPRTLIFAALIGWGAFYHHCKVDNLEKQVHHLKTHHAYDKSGKQRTVEDIIKETVEEVKPELLETPKPETLTPVAPKISEYVSKKIYETESETKQLVSEAVSSPNATIMPILDIGRVAFEKYRYDPKIIKGDSMVITKDALENALNDNKSLLKKRKVDAGDLSNLKDITFYGKYYNKPSGGKELRYEFIISCNKPLNQEIPESFGCKIKAPKEIRGYVKPGRKGKLDLYFYSKDIEFSPSLKVKFGNVFLRKGATDFFINKCELEPNESNHQIGRFLYNKEKEEGEKGLEFNLTTGAFKSIKPINRGS